MENPLGNIDLLIDINLKQIYDSPSSYLFWTDFKDDNEEYLSQGIARRLSKIMEERGLIEIELVNEYRCDITDFGIQIVKNGGWLKHLDLIEKERKIEAEREKKRDELLDLDLKLKSFENKIGKKIIIAGIIIPTLSFLLSFFTSEIKINRILKTNIDTISVEESNKVEVQTNDTSIVVN